MDEKSMTLFEGKPENKPDGKPEGTLSARDKVKRVLKLLLEVVGFLAAIKTLLT